MTAIVMTIVKQYLASTTKCLISFFAVAAAAATAAFVLWVCF